MRRRVNAVRTVVVVTAVRVCADKAERQAGGAKYGSESTSISEEETVLARTRANTQAFCHGEDIPPGIPIEFHQKH